MSIMSDAARLKNLVIFLKSNSLVDYRTYDRLNTFLTNNHDSVLGLIGYSSVFISELIRNYPKIKLLLRKLLFRLSLIPKTTGKTVDEEDEVPLTPTQQHLVNRFRNIYGYIADIRIASGIFAFIPYITTFLRDYSSIKKLKSIDSLSKLDKFASFVLFGLYQIYENLGFILSHDFLPDSFHYLLLPQHRANTGLSSSDWYYVYSCRFWMIANIIDSFKTLYQGKLLSTSQICNDILSYHWASSTGVLDKPTFAIIGFINTINSFKKLL